MDELNAIQKLAVWALPVLFAITVHETAHGWMALRLGDPTARMLGRLSLNPARHIDPVGTLLVPALTMLLGGVIFGWARPVPVTWENLRKPRRDSALVAVAGPLSNLLMGMLWALAIPAGVALGEGVGLYLAYVGVAGTFINAILLVLNLFPLPPLDGGRVAVALLPGPLGWRLSRVEPFGFLILIALLMTGLLGEILWPAVRFLLNLYGGLTGLSPEFYWGMLGLLTK